jgi:hypothetical protein
MPDMLSVGQGAQTQAQYRAQMLLWSVLGAPLILGADIRKLDAFTTALVTATEVLAVNADPDCVQGSLLRSRGSYSQGRVCHFALPLTAIGCHSLGVYNHSKLAVIAVNICPNDRLAPG